MPHEFEPRVGQWYRHLDKGQPFEVIALDEAQSIIEIQYYDGAIDELDLDSWRDLAIEPAEPPEDWTGPLDELEPDDLDYSNASDERAWGEEGAEYPERAEEWSNEPEDRAAAEGDESGSEEE